VNRAHRLEALLLACAACAHGPTPANPPSSYAASDYEVPAPPPGPSSAPAPAQSVSPGPSAAGVANAAQTATRLASIRASVDQTLAAEAKLLWETWTRGAPPDLDAGLARRELLSSADTLAFVKDARERARGDERRALALLHAFLVGEHLAGEAGSAEVPQATLTWEGHAVASAQVPRILAAEPDAARRAALEHAWAEAERRRTTADDARWRGIATAARRLGYDSLLALAAELRGEPIDNLATLARGVLDATELTYRSLLQALAREEMGVDLSRLHGRDLPRLLSAGEDARAFPAGHATADVSETLSALGLDLAGRPGVVLDLQARPGKDPRALALPIEVPGNVRVSFSPQGGATELRALLHEMGAATFYAHVANPVLEFRRLGTVTTECWAFLFEDLAGDPVWLSERTGLGESHLSPVIRAATARRLHTARTLAAWILVEVARARDPGRARATAKAVLETASAHAVEPDELQLFLQQRDPLLQSADGLRALLLAAQAQAYLASRAGPSWWRSKENGRWLASAFAEGSRLDPAELAHSFGAPSVNASALATSSRARAAAAGIRVAQAERR
jgi:hypothetical protein